MEEVLNQSPNYLTTILFQPAVRQRPDLAAVLGTGNHGNELEEKMGQSETKDHIADWELKLGNPDEES